MGIPFVAFFLAVKQTVPNTFLEQKYSLASFCKELRVASKRVLEQLSLS